MEIFVKIKRHSYYIEKVNDDISVEVGHWAERISMIYSNEEIAHNIHTQINKLTVEASSIPTPAKVYFDPYCKYPRFKISGNTNFKRVIKPLNADIVVFTPVPQISRFNSFPQHISHFLINGELYCIANKLLITPIHEILQLPSDTIIQSLKYPINRIIPNTIAPSIYNLFHTYTKIISNTDFDMIINSALLDMTDASYASIQEMLKSNDNSIFKLGIKMLSGFDTNSNAIRIGVLLVEHCNSRRHLLTDVNVQQILSTLKLSSRCFPQSNRKEYIAKLWAISTSDADRQFGRKLVVENARKLSNDYTASLVNAFEDFDIKVSINIE